MKFRFACPVFIKKITGILVSVFIVFIFLHGCASRQVREKPADNIIEFPLKIGILADSQVTTGKGESDYYLRSQWADKLANASIRPPALEHLTPEMLKIFLNHLSEEDVDFLLYLGDGANNGCEDEIAQVFTLLREHRKAKHIPIFFVIGNHDYLGAGNTAEKKIRKKLCQREGQSDNPAKTKYEVLKKISEFNKENILLSGIEKKLQYADNFSFLDAELTDMNGLYLAGQINYSIGGRDIVEIFLTDTSDYKDTWFKPKIGKVEFYGKEGSISYKGEKSQVGYFEKHAVNPQFRIIASHYPPTDFDVFSLFRFSFIQRALEKWLSDGHNYWISAHTHTTEPEKGEIPVGGIFSNRSFKAINVGSTIDHRPHVVIIENVSNTTNKVDGFIGYKVLRSDNKEYCTKVIDSMDSSHENYKSICGISSGETIFGLDTKYKERCWEHSDAKKAVENLELFISERMKLYPGETREDIVACTVNRSAEIEHKKPGFFDSFGSN